MWCILFNQSEDFLNGSDMLACYLLLGEDSIEMPSCTDNFYGAECAI
jgi:hypothetical protein